MLPLLFPFVLAVGFLLPFDQAVRIIQSSPRLSDRSSIGAIARSSLNKSLSVSTWPTAPFTFNIPVRQGVIHKLHVLSYHPARLSRQEVLTIALIHDEVRESLSYLEPDTELPRHEIVYRARRRPHHHETWNPDRINLEIAFMNGDSEPGRQHTAFSVWETLDTLVLEILDNGLWEGHYATVVLEILGMTYREVQVRPRYVNAGILGSLSNVSENDTAITL